MPTCSRFPLLAKTVLSPCPLDLALPPMPLAANELLLAVLKDRVVVDLLVLACSALPGAGAALALIVSDQSGFPSALLRFPVGNVTPLVVRLVVHFISDRSDGAGAADILCPLLSTWSVVGVLSLFANVLLAQVFRQRWKSQFLKALSQPSKSGEGGERDRAAGERCPSETDPSAQAHAEHLRGRERRDAQRQRRKRRTR